MAEYDLSAYDASLLTQSRDLADYFEAASAGGQERESRGELDVAKPLATTQRVRRRDQTTARLRLLALGDMIRMIDSGEISNRIAQEVFDQMFDTGKSAQVHREGAGPRADQRRG